VRDIRGAIGALTSPVQAQQPPPTEFVSACKRLVAFHNKLEKKKNQFSSKKEARALDQIAQQLQTMQTSDAAAVATALGDAKAGKSRRRAIDTAFQFCDSQGSFQPTPLSVPPRIDAVDTDVVQIAGTSDPGASISANGGAGIGAQTATADGTGAFSFGFPNVPLDKAVSVTVRAASPERRGTSSVVAVTRTISEGAFKAQTTSIPYGELVKGGSQGQPVMYRVEVFQFDTSTGANQFLGYVTPGSYDIWTDIVAFKLGDPAIGSGVVKDDIVRVWGTVGAPQTYSTRIGGMNTVPTVDVKYLTKQ
jgi:hypothetical protein